MGAGVNFYYYTLQHQASIIDFKIQSQKIISVDDYSQQPQIITIKCIADSWLKTHLLETNYEHSNNISIYGADVSLRQLMSTYKYRIYGVIDLTSVLYDEKQNTITFTVYDKILLLTRSQDYLDSYTSAKSLTDIMNNVEDITFEKYFNLRLTDNLLHGWAIHASKPTLEKTDLQLFSTNRFELVDDTSIRKTWQEDYTEYEWNHGFLKTAQDKIFWIEWGYVEITESIGGYDTDVYYYYVSSWKLFHNIQYSEYYTTNGRIEDDLDATELAIKWAINKIGGSIAYDTTSLTDTAVFDSETGEYSHSPYIQTEIVKFTGDVIPNSMYFSDYDTKLDYTGSSNFISTISVLKTILTIYNQFLYYDRYQNMIIASKDFESTSPITVAREDIIELERGRKSNNEFPNASLYPLSGETDVLAEVLKEYYNDFYSKRQIIDANIIDDYDLKLLDDIIIDEVTYKITEIMPMQKEKLINVVAWRV